MIAITAVLKSSVSSGTHKTALIYGRLRIAFAKGFEDILISSWCLKSYYQSTPDYSNFPFHMPSQKRYNTNLEHLNVNVTTDRGHIWKSSGHLEGEVEGVSERENCPRMNAWGKSRRKDKNKFHLLGNYKLDLWSLKWTSLSKSNILQLIGLNFT